MKLSVFPEQSNTKEGPFQILASGDLTGKEGHLAKLGNSSGTAVALLPTDVADEADYLILEGGADETFVTVVALDRSGSCRLRLSGTCKPGDKLTLGAIDGTHDGMVRTLPVAADTYWVALRAEEAGVDDQLVKCRLLPNPGPEVVR